MILGVTRRGSRYPVYRVIAGILLSPLLGPLFYYLLVAFADSVPYVAYASSDYFLPVYPDFLMAGILIGGTIFYGPAVIAGFAIMLLLGRVIKWTIVTCIAGALGTAVMVSLLFALLLLLAVPGQLAAFPGFFLLLKLIYLPSIVGGICFWTIAVFRNDGLSTAMPSMMDSKLCAFVT